MNNNCNQHNHCIHEAITKAELICNDRNLALTPLRHKVLELIWQEEHQAIKAYDLLEKLKKDEPNAKPVTVYRALDFLLEQHLIHKLESQNSYIGCNHPTRQHNCAFLICDHCHTVNECCDNGSILKTITNSINPKDFSVQSITLEIHGLCNHCQQ